MNVKNVADEIKKKLNEYAKEIPMQRIGSESDSGHLLWMLKGIQQGYVQHDKAHRWIGFIQGVLVSKGIFSVEELKKINKRSHDSL